MDEPIIASKVVFKDVLQTEAALKMHCTKTENNDADKFFSEKNDCSSNIDNLPVSCESANTEAALNIQLAKQALNHAGKILSEKDGCNSTNDNLTSSPEFKESGLDIHHKIVIETKQILPAILHRNEMSSSNVTDELEPSPSIEQRSFQQELNTGASGSTILPIEKCKYLPKVEQLSTGLNASQDSVMLNNQNRENVLDGVKSIDDGHSNTNESVVPASHPVGQMKRKHSEEAFHVKNIQPNESSIHCNPSKTKIRPILGHARVTTMLKDKGPFPVIFIGSPSISDMKAYIKEASGVVPKTVVETTDVNSKVNDLVSHNCKTTQHNSATTISDTANQPQRFQNGNKKKDSCSQRASVNENTQPPFNPKSEVLNSTALEKLEQISEMESSNVNIMNRDSEYDLKKVMDGFLGGHEDDDSLPKKNSRHSNMSTQSLNDIMLYSRPSMVVSNDNLRPNSMGSSVVDNYFAPKMNITPYNMAYKPWLNSSGTIQKHVPRVNHINQFSNPQSKAASSSTAKPVYFVPFTSKQQSFNALNQKLSTLKPRSLPNVAASASTIISTVQVSAPGTGNNLSVIPLNTSSEACSKKNVKEELPSSSDSQCVKSNKFSTITKTTHTSLVAAERKPVKRKAEPGLEDHSGFSQILAKKMRLHQNLQSSKGLNKCISQANSDESGNNILDRNCSMPTNPKKPGVLVKFVEDGVRLWIDRLRDLMYLDDEPVKTWKLSPGTEVAAKYTDGLFYDAIILGTYDGKTTVQLKEEKKDLKVENRKKPEVKCRTGSSPTKRSVGEASSKRQTHETAKEKTQASAKSPSSQLIPGRRRVGRPSSLNKEETRVPSETKKKISQATSPTVYIKKLELSETPETNTSQRLKKEAKPPKKSTSSTDDCPDSDNPTLKIKCTNCFLVFKSLSLFRMHQKTVCGGNGVPVTGFDFEADTTVKVDEKGDPPLVTSHPKPTDDPAGRMRLIPRAPDGKRCFRRGTRILHRWQTMSGSRWFNGKILRLLETNKGARCEFEVEYTDDDHDSGPYAVCLYEDYPHDVRIVTR